MNAIITLFGFFNAKFLLLNLVALVAAFFVISSFITNKFFRKVFAIIFSIISALQIISFYITRTFISYSFIIHFNTRDILGMKDLFGFEMLLGLLLFVLLFVIYYKSLAIVNSINTGLRIKLSIVKVLKVFGLVVSVLIMTFKTGVIHDGYTLIKNLNVNHESFNKELSKLKMQDYVKPENLVVGEAQKNIIIISLESFEKGYLSNKHAKLTPNLRALKADKDNWFYLELNQNQGSTWTSGSLYTAITGFPAYFGTEANSIFQTSFRSSITGISHILKKANHDLIYVTDNAEVSGTKDMLYALDIVEIIDQKNLNKKTKDKDIFELAKQRLKESKTRNKPFTLIMSTLSTHFPNGIYDDRMEAYLPPQASDLEFMVSATDYLLQDFVTFLKTENFLDNTVVYIFPDHLKMGSDAIFKDTGDRGLFVLTNASSQKIAPYKTNNFFQIDLPKLILDGAQVKHNAKFLSDYIFIDKNTYIVNNITQLTSLNLSGFSRLKKEPYLIPTKTEHYNTYIQDTSRFIAHAGGAVDKQTYTNSLEALNLNYNKGFRLFELDIRKTNDNKFVAVHYWEEWAEKTGFKGSLPPSHQEFLENRLQPEFTPLDMDSINQWFKTHNDAILVTDKINTPRAFSNNFIDKNRLIMELFTWEAVKEGIACNIKSAMPSQRVLMDLGPDVVVKFKAHGVTDVAVSRYNLAQEIDLIKELKQNGIKVYLYNIGDYKEINEDYVVKYEMDYIYGIYADEWEFK